MTDHIKMNPVPPRIVYVGTGSQTQFSFPFPIFNSANLSVSLDGAVQNAGFFVTGAGQSNGGTITFYIAPPLNSVIVIERRLPLQRISDFLEGGEFSANSLNNELDYLAGCLQQLAEDMAPMVRVQNSEIGINTTLPGRTQRAHKMLGFDGDGQFMMVDTTNTYSVPNFTALGTGAITRTLTDKARERISVKDYGAVGDGVTDDSIALINAIAANSSIYLPPGTYLTTQTIEIGNNKTIFGEGKASIVKAVSSSIDTIALIGSYSTLSDLAIEGGDTGLMLYGKTSPCTQNVVRNISIKNAVIGIELDGYTSTSNPCQWNVFEDIFISRMAVDGVYLHLTGAGDLPMSNKFSRIQVASGAINSTGYGFNIAGAKFQNAFIDCEAHMATTAAGCFYCGPSSSRTIIINLHARSTGGSVSAVKLASGSIDTSIFNLYPNVSGAQLDDLSGGSYSSISAGNTDKNRMRRTRIGDLTTELQRYLVQTVSLPSSGTVTVDLTKSTYLVNATNGAVTLQLPTASSDNLGATIMAKKTDSSTYNVIISESGGNGPDNRSLRLGALNDYATIISDGSKWHVINTNVMPASVATFTGSGTFIPDLTRSVYLVTATGLVTMQLPSASSAQAAGRMISVKKVDNSSNYVRITEDSGPGPDNGWYNLTSLNQAVTLYCSGSAWLVISKHV